MGEKLEEIITIFHEKMKEFEPYQKLATKQEEYEKELKQKYYSKLISENIDLLEPVNTLSFQDEREKKRALEN